MEGWDSLIPWIGQVTGAEPEGEFFDELWDGVLLCEVINGIEPGKINIEMDFEANERAAITNLENFIAVAKEWGVDDAHIFDLGTLYESTEPDAKILDSVRTTLSSLKTIVEQRGTLEQQNIWRKDAAEVRAHQNRVKGNFAKKENKTLSDVTGAVREFKNRSNQDGDLRYQRKGQQKWKMFETNYQREKGISLEQSLAEIEEFERTGKMPESMKKKNMNQRAIVGSSNAFMGVLEDTLNKDKDKEGQTNSASQSNGAAGSASAGGMGGARMVGGGKRVLNEKPKVGGGAGAAFFQQFAAKEGQKYKPGNNNGKKLW